MNKIVYLDYAATSPLLPEVKGAMCDSMSQLFGNAASIHTPGHDAHKIIENAREKVAKLINAKPSEIIFTSGASEGNNTVMHTFAGKNIMVSPFEHPSITLSARKYAKNVETMLCFTGHASAPPVVTGVRRSFSLVSSERPLKNIALVSTQLANHEIGTVFPIAELAKQAHEQGAYFHTDATQAIGKIPVDVKKLGVDYLTFSAHKFGGPTGVGVLYVKDGAPFESLILGGHQENNRRAGTHNTIGIIGLAAAADYIMKNNTPAIYEKKIRPLRDLLEKRILKEIQGSEINSFRGHPQLLRGRSDEPREDGREERPRNGYISLPNILNISFKGAEGESIQLMLDHEGIIVSTGSACAATDGQPSPVLMALHGDAEIAHSSIRFSLGLDTTKKDIDRIMQVLPAIIKKLQGISTI